MLTHLGVTSFARAIRVFKVVFGFALASVLAIMLGLLAVARCDAESDAPAGDSSTPKHEIVCDKGGSACKTLCHGTADECTIRIDVISPGEIPPVVEYGAIEVASEPSGAVVQLDGEDVKDDGIPAITPTTISDVTVGEHTLTLTLTDYTDMERVVTVVANKTTKVNVTLMPEEVPLGIYHIFVKLQADPEAPCGQCYETDREVFYTPLKVMVWFDIFGEPSSRWQCPISGPAATDGRSPILCKTDDGDLVPGWLWPDFNRLEVFGPVETPAGTTYYSVVATRNPS